MRRLLLALVSGALLADQAWWHRPRITGNYVEDFDHPFVALIAFYSDRKGTDDAFLHRCTGSLVDDGTPLDGSRVVTAGHCTDDGTGDAVAVSARLWFRQDAGTRTTAPAIRSPATRTRASMTRLWTTGSRCASRRTRCTTTASTTSPASRRSRCWRDHPRPGVILPEYATIADAGTITSNKAVKVTCRATASPMAMRPATRRSRSASA